MVSSKLEENLQLSPAAPAPQARDGLARMSLRRLIFLMPLLCAIPALAASRVVVSDGATDPPTLDPFQELIEKNHTIIQQMIEGLVRFDPTGKIEPALAESWEQISPTRLRFHLRHRVSFQNGEDFDADSVRFSIEHYIDPAVGYPGRNFFNSIDHVEVVDSHTVDLITRYPDGVLLRRLAGLITIVPPHYYQQKGSEEFSKHPIGTGPFEFVHWIGKKEIAFKAYKHYWQPGVPKVDELIFRFIPDNQRVDALLSGSTDIITELPGTATLQVQENTKTVVLKKESFYTIGATFNTANWPLSDKRFRQALNYAINRPELIRYDLLGNGRPIATLSMPGQAGHAPDLHPYPFDLNKARRLLKEVGIKGPVHLKTHAMIQAGRTAKILAEQLKQINVFLDPLEIVTEDQIVQRLKEKSWNWDVGISGIPDPTAHASFIQSILLYSKSPYSLLKDADFDHRLEDVMSTISPELQESKARQLDSYIYDNALSLFTYQRIKTYGIRRGVKFSPYVTGMPYYSSLEVLRDDVNNK